MLNEKTLNLNEKSKWSELNDNDIEEEESDDKLHTKHGYACIPPFVTLFPTVIHIMSGFIKKQDFTTQCTETDYYSSFTVTMPHIRSYLLQSIPGLKEHNKSL